MPFEESPMHDFRLRTLKPRYEELYASCKVRSSWLERITNVADKIVSLRSQYAAIETQTTVPWWFVGILHYRQAAFQDAHLYNGDPLTSRTVREPSGRPAASPANGQTYTFVESAVDALRWKEFDRAKDRSIPAWLWRFEIWGGFGYAMRGLNSEYLWNGTNHFGSGKNRGKFVTGNLFDANATSDQVGAAAVLWYLQNKGIIASNGQPLASSATAMGLASVSAHSNPSGARATQAATSTATKTNPATIQILDVFRYYQKLPHQDSAIAWLQQQLSAELLSEFARRWREGSANGTPGTSAQTSNNVVAKTPVIAPPPPTKLDTLEERIIAYCEEKKYKIDRGPGEKNIIYIEGMYPNGELNDDAFNAWNDTRMVIEFKDGVPKILGKWEATTEPGRYYTIVRPMNVNGAARIAFGQYKAWIVGTHLNSHEALVQLGGPVTVYRDLNKDGQRSGDRTQIGQFGINQHWGGDAAKNDIGRWSAGCLVGRTRDGHREFMSTIKKDPRYLKSRAYVFSSIVIPGDDLFKRYPPS